MAGKTPGWCSPAICARRWTRETSGNVQAHRHRGGAGDDWPPRELRTSFVSLMSDQGVTIEEIARLAGHASTRTTEIVYRREVRPVITTGAEIMDELFTGV
jgi:integrase